MAYSTDVVTLDEGAFKALEDTLESSVWETVINALPPLEEAIRAELGELYKTSVVF